MVRQMNKKEAEAYILELPKFTTKNSPDHTGEFLARLGNPQEGKKILHVAGTNGKGSVCVYMQAMLIAEGKKTGLFISPHLEKINERIKIDGKDISDEEFLNVFLEVKRTVDEMMADNLSHPTFFEFLFGMAMKAFERAGVEYIVLETGLGGRLDATNVIENPAVTVITSISLDHTEILGDTIEKIAKEKAGIIKEGVPAVFLDGQESTKVIEEIAARKKSPCIKISKNAYEILEIKEKHIDFSTTNAYDKYTTWELHNTGKYQVENAMLALKAMEILFPGKEDLENWREALSSVVWSGRMEEILPGVIVDGAHNLGAIEQFAQSVKSEEGLRNVILFSAVQEKDYEKMAAHLCENVRAKAYVITKIQNVRGVDTEVLGALFRKYTDAEVIVKEDFREAFQAALQKKGEKGRLYCLGSLYLVGMLKELIGEEQNA